MSELTPTQKRERMIALLQQAFADVAGPAEVRAFLTELMIKKFSELSDEKCAGLWTAAEMLLAGLKHTPETSPPSLPPTFDPVAALAEHALVLDRVRQKYPDEAAQRRLDWVAERLAISPWRLQGCAHEDIERELEEIAEDEELFADFTPAEQLATEQRLARIVDFENATFADYIALIENERGDELLLSECEALLGDSELAPQLRRLVRAMVSAPLKYRAMIAAFCDPRLRSADTLSFEDYTQIYATLRLLDVPERDADGDAVKPSEPHLH
jgi:hypothetical protein